MHPELVQRLDVDLCADRRRAAGRRRLIVACPRVVDRPPVPGRRAVADGLRRRLGFWLVAAGLRLALPRA